MFDERHQMNSMLVFYLLDDYLLALVDVDASLVGLLIHLHAAKCVPGIVGVAVCVLGYCQVDICVYVFSDVSYYIFSVAFTWANFDEDGRVDSCKVK